MTDFTLTAIAGAHVADDGEMDGRIVWLRSRRNRRHDQQDEEKEETPNWQRAI